MENEIAVRNPSYKGKTSCTKRDGVASQLGTARTEFWNFLNTYFRVQPNEVISHVVITENSIKAFIEIKKSTWEI